MIENGVRMKGLCVCGQIFSLRGACPNEHEKNESVLKKNIKIRGLWRANARHGPMGRKRKYTVVLSYNTHTGKK